MGKFEDQCNLLFPGDTGMSKCCVDNITPELMHNGVVHQKAHIHGVCSRLAQEKQAFEASRDSWCTKMYPKHVDCCKVSLTDDELHAAIDASNRKDPILGTIPAGMEPEAWVKLTGKESDEVKKQKKNRKERMDTVTKATVRIDKTCKMNIYVKRAGDVGIAVVAGNLATPAATLGRAVGESMYTGPGRFGKQLIRGGKYGLRKAMGKGGEAGEADEAATEAGEAGEAAADMAEVTESGEGVEAASVLTEAGEVVAGGAEAAGGEVATDTVVAGAAVAAPVIVAGVAAVGSAAADAATAAALYTAGLAAETMPGIGTIVGVGLVGIGAVYSVKEWEDE